MSYIGDFIIVRYICIQFKCDQQSIAKSKIQLTTNINLRNSETMLHSWLIGAVRTAHGFIALVTVRTKLRSGINLALS